MSERLCAYCGLPLPPSRQANKNYRYCDLECSHAAGLQSKHRYAKSELGRATIIAYRHDPARKAAKQAYHAEYYTKQQEARHAAKP